FFTILFLSFCAQMAQAERRSFYIDCTAQVASANEFSQINGTFTVEDDHKDPLKFVVDIFETDYQLLIEINIRKEGLTSELRTAFIKDHNEQELLSLVKTKLHLDGSDHVEHHYRVDA